MFESVDGRTDGRRLESHPITSSRTFGSGELKMCRYSYVFVKSRVIVIYDLCHCNVSFIVFMKITLYPPLGDE